MACLSSRCLLFAVAVRLTASARVHVHHATDDVGPGAAVEAPDWFLTKGELSASRFGEDRGGLADWSPGNSIKILLNGAEFMPRLYDVIESAQAGDSVHGTGWQLDGSVMLKPDPEHPAESANTTLLATLSRALARGVSVRLLISSNIYQYMEARALCNALMQEPACSQSPCCAPDNRHGHDATGTNHEKIWTVGLRQERRLVVFMGSMDVTRTRWDTAAHDITTETWNMQPKNHTLTFAWHDNMMEIEGGAAEDIESTFWQRWNDPVKPMMFYDILPPYNLWVPSALDTDASFRDDGLDAVQVVRTFGCQGAQKQLYQGFAPHGEYSYAAMWFKALRRARRFIFVADQFMFFKEAMEAVAEAAQHVDFVVVLTDRGMNNFGQGTVSGWGAAHFESFMGHYQYESLLAPLKRLDPSGKLATKVHMFSLVKEGMPEEQMATQIYDHEKTLIIDDEFALTGSTGVERTGFTNDAELSMGVWTPPSAERDRHGSFAARLRRRIWAEYLMLAEDDDRLVDPSVARAEWLRQADAGDKRVRHHAPKQGGNSMDYSKIYDFMEPDGRCEDEPHKVQWDAARMTGSPDWLGVVAKIPLERMNSKA